MYRYFGAHWACKVSLVVTLLSSSAPTGSHAAVWLGAENTPLSRWVQAGVANIGGQNFRYIEWERPIARGGYGIELLPWPEGKPLRVRLQSRGSDWRASDGAGWSPWVYLKHSARCSVLELYNGAHGVAEVSRQHISG